MPTIARPDPEEYAPYHQRYIDLLPAGDILGILETQSAELLTLLRGLPADRDAHRYAPGKWTVRELVGHLLDCERVFTHRALWIARGGPPPLPSFEQDDWVREGGWERRRLHDLVSECSAVRTATLQLFRGFDAEQLRRRGIAAGRECSVRAFPYLIAGHERHHTQILKERYL